MEAQRKKDNCKKNIKKTILIIAINIIILSFVNCQDRLIVLWDVDTSINCKVSDVVILLDSTGSMGLALDSVKTMLSGTIIPGLSESINDLQIGIATYEDIPTAGYGALGDLPLTVVQKVTDNFSAVQSAVNGVSLGSGGDGPESLIEALYLMSTNESFGSWFSPQSCGSGRSGAMCFREEATPIIIVVTDDYSHNGPGDSNPYSGVTPTPHTYDQAKSVLESIGGHVLGINTSSYLTSIPDLLQLAIDTESVDENGDPIVVNLSSGADSAQTIVDAVSSFCFTE